MTFYILNQAKEGISIMKSRDSRDVLSVFRLRYGPFSCIFALLMVKSFILTILTETNAENNPEVI